MPAPDQAVIARRDAIAAALRRIVPGEGVILSEPELKIIDVFVCKLRKKLAQATGGDHYIETVWGRGDVLRDPVEAAAD